MLLDLALLIVIFQRLISAVIAAKVIQSSDGVRIWADAVGSPQNQALVLIHGIGGSALVWEDLIKDQRLLSTFYLVTYDLRGYGRSDKPTTVTGYTSKLFADDFTAVSRAFNLKSPVVLGWDYGGTVFADIFSNLPAGSTSALVGVAAVPFTGVPNILTTNALTLVPGIVMANILETSISNQLSVLDNSYNNASAIPYETRMKWLGAAVTQGPLGSRSLESRVQDTSALFAAGRQGFSLLMIYGTNDQILQNEVIINATAPNFPKMQVKRIIGGSHAVFYENKDEFVEALLVFFKALPSSSSKGVCVLGICVSVV